MKQARTSIELMLLDADESRAQMIRSYLADDSWHRYQTTLCRESAQTVELLSNRDFDLLMISLEPAANFDVISKIQGSSPSIPILAYSSSKHEDRATKAVEAGVTDYILLDGLTPRTLSKAIRQLLELGQKKELEIYVQRLRETEESFLKIIRHNRDGIVVVDAKNIVRFVNPMAEAMMQTKAMLLVGKACPHMLAKEDAFELELNSGSNSPLFVHVQSLPIQWDDQKAFVASLRDISDRIQLERRKDDFLNTVSHELRTPLTVIREGISQVMEGLHGPTTDAQKTFLNISFQSSQQLQKIVDDLLDVAKLEEGKVRLDFTSFGLCELVRDTVTGLQPVAKKKSLSLTSFLPKDSIHILADRDRIGQVLNNLINNAIKFTEQGGIELRLVERDNQAEILVSDTGRGISPLDLPKVFSKFEQFGKKTEGAKGTGLGLSICKHLVELHRGSISIKSDLGKGTTFTIVLPKRDVKEVYCQLVDAELKSATAIRGSFSLIVCAGLEGDADDSFPRPEQMIRVGYDVAFRDKSVIYILLPATPRTGARVVVDRIRKVFKQCSFVCEPVIRAATYPEDGTTPEALLRLIT